MTLKFVIIAFLASRTPTYSYAQPAISTTPTLANILSEAGVASPAQTTTELPVYNETHNPCTREIDTEPPNFKELGRRISEEKCLYYIWRVNVNSLLRKKNYDCLVYLKVQFLIGGRSAAPGEFPHMGALGWLKSEGYRNYAFKCGASLISPLFLITAAHCAKSRQDPELANQEPTIVRLGANSLEHFYRSSQYPMDRDIKKITQHPNYKPPKQYFDIALVELSSKVELSHRIQPACLWTHSEVASSETFGISSSGWGATEVRGRSSSNELKVGDLDVIIRDACDILLKPMCNRRWCGVRNHQICAGKLAGGVDTCNGDSGGPLQSKINLPSSIQARMYYLLGVTSFGFGCARQNSPGVYTAISSFVDWIETNVWPNDDSL